MSKIRLELACEKLQADMTNMFNTASESGLSEMPFIIASCRGAESHIAITQQPENHTHKMAILSTARDFGKQKKCDVVGICFEAWIKKIDLKTEKYEHVPGSLSEDNSNGEVIMLVIQDKETSEKSFSVAEISKENGIRKVGHWEDYPAAEGMSGLFAEFNFFEETIGD